MKSYTFRGIGASDFSGVSVSSAGNVDGDGKDDFIIGAPKADPNGSISGEIYLISGADLAALDAASAGTPGVIELSDLAATGNSYQFIGADRGDWAGYSISSAGDVDKDGKDDFIIGAPRADPNGTTSGSVYLISGADLVALDLASGADGVIELSDVAAGSKSYQFNGVSAGDEAGSSISSLRDVDGDGHDDLIIGAIDADPNGNSSGEIYFISGIDLAALDRASGVDGVIDLSDVAGTGGSYQFNGIALGDNAGSSVSSAGDVDGDGKDDLIIGAAMGQSNGVDSGEIYLISGKDFADLDFASGMDGVIELSDVAAVRGSYQFVGASANDQAGFAISSAGDVDNDGKDDLIIAAVTADPNGSTNAGETYIIAAADLADLDAASGTNGVIELSDVAATMTGNSYQFSGSNAMDNAGYSVSSAGDVDGDGKGDFIIGAPRADPNGNASGETYFISGADLADLDARSGADGVIELIHAICFARGTLIQTQLGEVPI
ncbi:integrin alpha, partial [Planktomarina sp.]|uniref:integrin alpha n=2 Tax=Planktomarina sp. TaxID=2024851 RepID=UPI003C37A35B